MGVSIPQRPRFAAILGAVIALAVLVLAATSAAGARPAPEETYGRLKPSLFTIEVHSGNDGARASLGSGYLVSQGGLIVTNYHVVSAYVDEPARYSLRARGVGGDIAVRLRRFDVVNDLALLEASGVRAAPLPIASAEPPPGSPVVSFGNPEGLGLSLIEGIFNGFAEKGLVDRMLLSMPLNAGMSGGPILDAHGRVIGTNVSIKWLSNSLSFGVPASKLQALLDGPPVALDAKSLTSELSRQLEGLERETAERLLAQLQAVPEDALAKVGQAATRRLPPAFDCWDDTEEYRDEGVTKSRYGCNLQFTPATQQLGEVASVQVLIEHFDSERSGYGFFGTLPGHALSHNEVTASDPTSGVVSPPHCTSDRARVNGDVFKLTTCASAYVRHPGLGRFDLMGTSLGNPRAATFLWLKMTGFRRESFEAVARHALLGLRTGAP
jgi:serine protease Do